jgi:hypothetical protein
VTDTQTRPDVQQAAAPGRGVPVWIGVAVYAAAMALWGIQAAAGPVPVLVGITLAGALAALIVRSRTDAGRRPALAAVTLAVLWVMLFAVFGWTWLLTAVWASLIGILLPAWRRHHLAGQPAQIEIPTQLESAAAVLDSWTDYVAADGPLKDTRLALVSTDGRVHKFNVLFIRGKHTHAQLLGQRAQIVSALDVPEENVIIEKGRTGATAKLTVITDVSDRPPVMYPGPRFDPETGLVGFAKYDDTLDEAFLSIIDTNGSFGATFCGDQGSGKSACMEQIGLSLIASGYFVGLYVDPQGGMSSPALAKACKWSATSVTEAAALVRALPRWRRLRQIVFRRKGRNGYQLSKEHPVVILFMDEFHEIVRGLSPADQAILVEMAKTLRKLGGCLMVGTQNVGIDAFGGNNDLRTQLMSRNVVYFYTSSRQQGHLSGKNDFDPSTLPSGTPGYGYLKEIRVGGKLITRAAPIRAYYLGHERDFDGKNPGLAWAEHLAANYTFASLPPEEAGALGAAFARRSEARAESDAAEDAFLAACEAAGRGQLDPEELAEFDPDVKPKPQQSSSGLPSLRLGGPEEEPADQYPEKTQAVLDALRAGAWGTAEIIRRAAVTVSSSHVEQTLSRLIDEGKIVKIGTGHYHAAGATDCGRTGCRG